MERRTFLTSPSSSRVVCQKSPVSLPRPRDFRARTRRSHLAYTVHMVVARVPLRACLRASSPGHPNSRGARGHRARFAQTIPRPPTGNTRGIPRFGQRVVCASQPCVEMDLWRGCGSACAAGSLSWISAVRNQNPHVRNEIKTTRRDLAGIFGDFLCNLHGIFNFVGIAGNDR